MRDSTNHDGAEKPNSSEEPNTPSPHEDDLRSIMFGRPGRSQIDVGSGDFSSEAQPESQPVWTDAASEQITSGDPTWHGRDDEVVERPFEREYQHPPDYADAESEEDDRHPLALSRFGPPAGFGRRLIAYLIDNAVTIVILSLLFPLMLGRPYIDYEAIAAEIEAAGDEVAALPTATPVLGNVDQQAQGDDFVANSNETQSLGELFGGLFLAFAVTTIYNTILVGIWGTTVGKRILNVYVLDGDGNITGIPLAFARALATIVSTLIFYIGYLFILRSDHRALHDLLVGTYAITLRSSERPTQREQRMAD